MNTRGKDVCKIETDGMGENVHITNLSMSYFAVSNWLGAK